MVERVPHDYRTAAARNPLLRGLVFAGAMVWAAGLSLAILASWSLGALKGLARV